jgi:nucleoside-diphosphate-sugar epimerase
MRALVLGATGHVGHAFTRALLARGWEVTATHRRPGQGALLAGLPVHVRSGDDATPGLLVDWVRGHDLVVDAAAPYHYRLAPLANTWVVHAAARRMRALLEGVAAARARLIHVSSFTTLSRERSIFGLAQSALLAQLHPYFELKRRMEAQVRGAARRGVESVIVNPTHCLGPFDARPLEHCLIPLVLRGELPAVHGHAVNVIDVRDVAAAALAAHEQRRFGEPIPLVGHNTTLYGLVSAIARRGGVLPPRRHVPPRLTALAAYGNEVLAALGASPFAHPSLGMLLAIEQHWDAPGAVQRRLLPQLRPLSRTLAEAIEWYAGLGYLEPRATASGMVVAEDVLQPRP